MQINIKIKIRRERKKENEAIEMELFNENFFSDFAKDERHNEIQVLQYALFLFLLFLRCLSSRYTSLQIVCLFICFIK